MVILRSNRHYRRSPMMTRMRLMAPTTLLVMVVTMMAPMASALEKTWTLYHSLNGGQDFARRASVLLLVDPETDSVEMTITNDNSTLTKDAYKAAKAPGAMYQLKLEEDGGSPDTFVLTTVPGCQLLRANFRDEIVVTFGPKASAISLAHMPLVSPLAPKSCDDEMWETKLANNDLPEGWESRISWETATPGMMLRPVMPSYNAPPGLKWLPRMSNNGKVYQAQGPPGTGEDGDGEGNPPKQPEITGPMGFIKQYWYIIIPVMVMNLMGGEPPAVATGDQAAVQAGTGAAAVAGGAAAAAGAAVGAGGGAPKSRRGKRN